MKLYAENLREGQKKSMHFQNKRTPNLEFLGGIHKKNATLLETSLLEICGKFPVCHLKIEGVYQKSTN